MVLYSPEIFFSIMFEMFLVESIVLGFREYLCLMVLLAGCWNITGVV